MAGAGNAWHHGYDLSRQTGIRSGTLYPLLMRLEAQGHLEAEWQAPKESGRPARHVYRLTAAGRKFAAEYPPMPVAHPATDPGTRLA